MPMQDAEPLIVYSLAIRAQPASMTTRSDDIRRQLSAVGLHSVDGCIPVALQPEPKPATAAKSLQC